MRKTLEKSPPVEVRRRIEQILTNPQFLVKSPEERRALRALAVLEQIGTKESLAVLQALAKGQPLARITLEAENASRRLALRLSRP